jgi:hypothetical protein
MAAKDLPLPLDLGRCTVLADGAARAQVSGVRVVAAGAGRLKHVDRVELMGSVQTLDDAQHEPVTPLPGESRSHRLHGGMGSNPLPANKPGAGAMSGTW